MGWLWQGSWSPTRHGRCRARGSPLPTRATRIASPRWTADGVVERETQQVSPLRLRGRCRFTGDLEVAVPPRRRHRRPAPTPHGHFGDPQDLPRCSIRSKPRGCHPDVLLRLAGAAVSARKLPTAVPDDPSDGYGLLACILDQEGKFAEVWAASPAAEAEPQEKARGIRLEDERG